jgi:hypothetical protein
MIKIIKIIVLISILSSTSSITSAETKNDCSQYSTKTFTGLAAKMRCKKGLPPLEKKKKGFFSGVNLFKPKDPKEVKAKNPCTEHSSYVKTKTLKDVFKKLTCEKD